MEPSLQLLPLELGLLLQPCLPLVGWGCRKWRARPKEPCLQIPKVPPGDSGDGFPHVGQCESQPRPWLCHPAL